MSANRVKSHLLIKATRVSESKEEGKIITCWPFSINRENKDERFKKEAVSYMVAQDNLVYPRDSLVTLSPFTDVLFLFFEYRESTNSSELMTLLTSTIININ